MIQHARREWKARSKGQNIYGAVAGHWIGNQKGEGDVWVNGEIVAHMTQHWPNANPINAVSVDYRFSAGGKDIILRKIDGCRHVLQEWIAEGMPSINKCSIAPLNTVKNIWKVSVLIFQLESVKISKVCVLMLRSIRISDPWGSLLWEFLWYNGSRHYRWSYSGDLAAKHMCP